MDSLFRTGALPSTKLLPSGGCTRGSETVLSSSAFPSWDWKPAYGLYSLPYLQPEPPKNEESGYLTQAEWWELLFFIKKLDLCEQQPILQNLHEKLDKVQEAYNIWADEGCGGLELGTPGEILG